MRCNVSMCVISSHPGERINNVTIKRQRGDCKCYSGEDIKTLQMSRSQGEKLSECINWERDLFWQLQTEENRNCQTNGFSISPCLGSSDVEIKNIWNLWRQSGTILIMSVSKTLAMNLLNFQNLACQAFSNFRIILKFSNEKLKISWPSCNGHQHRKCIIIRL